CVKPIVRQGVVVVRRFSALWIPPWILTQIRLTDLPVHLHDRREASKLCPANEQIGRRDRRKIVVLVGADIVPPDGESAHGSGQSSSDHARQPVPSAEIRFVVARPARREGLGSRK